jgi:prefoldin beta subunit
MSEYMAQANETQEAEKVIREYQITQEQLRAASMQLDQMQIQKAELAKAKEEVTGSTGKVYISVGGVIVETTKEKALEEIKSRSEMTDVRISSLTKQYTELKTKDKQLNERLTQMYKQSKGTS